MKRIKRVFLWVHLVLWTLFGLLLALQLSQDTPSWLQLSVAVMLTTLYVFYSHFFLLVRYSGKRKKGAYYSRLAGIILSGPVLYLLLHYRKLDSFDLLQEYYLVSLFSIVLPFVFLSWLARVTENLVVNTVKKEQLEKQAVEAECRSCSNGSKTARHDAPSSAWAMSECRSPSKSARQDIA